MMKTLFFFPFLNWLYVFDQFNLIIVFFVHGLGHSDNSNLSEVSAAESAASMEFIDFLGVRDVLENVSMERINGFCRKLGLFQSAWNVN